LRDFIFMHEMQQNHSILNLEKSYMICIRVWPWDYKNKHKVQ